MASYKDAAIAIQTQLTHDDEAIPSIDLVRRHFGSRCPAWWEEAAATELERLRQ